MTDPDGLAVRLAELEIHVAHRDRMIDDLNDALRRQWDAIDRQRRDIDRLTAELRQVGDDRALAGGGEKPPHY